jgi:hypothetical protein
MVDNIVLHLGADGLNEVDNLKIEIFWVILHFFIYSESTVTGVLHCFHSHT